MPTIVELVQRLQANRKVFWQGSVEIEAVDQLENLLGQRLPDSFRLFLQVTGGGGVSNAWISGIEDGRPEIVNRGTVLGDTQTCQYEYEFPPNLVVIYLDDDVVWCLDTSRFDNGECPVVAFNIFSGKASLLFDTFAAFFEDYVQLNTT